MGLERIPFYATEYAKEHAKDKPRAEIGIPVCPDCDLTEAIRKQAAKNKENKEKEGVKQ
jgi:hypothetical protein